MIYTEKDVFSQEQINKFIEHVILSKVEFAHSTLINSYWHPEISNSFVLFEWNFVSIASIFRVKLKDVLSKLGIDFDFINLRLVCNINNQSYSVNNLNKTNYIYKHQYTFTYYFWQLPKRFQGGELEFKPSGTLIMSIRPDTIYKDLEYNSLFIFPVDLPYENLPVILPEELNIIDYSKMSIVGSIYSYS